MRAMLETIASLKLAALLRAISLMLFYILYAGSVTAEIEESAVVFRGISSLSQQQLARMAKLTLDTAPDDEQLALAQERLLKHGIFYTVSPARHQGQVYIELTPLQQVISITSSGATYFTTEELRRISRLRIGAYLEKLDLEQAVVLLKQRYEENGYRNARIVLEAEKTSSEFFVNLVIRVVEGYQSKIVEIDVKGDFPKDIKDIPQRLRQDAIGLAASKKNIETLRRNLLLAIRREGYLQATVLAPTRRVKSLKSGAAQQQKLDLDYVLKFEVKTGSPLSIVFTGNKSFSAEELLVPLRMESRTVPFTPGAVAALSRQIAELYQERGYFDVVTSWKELKARGKRKRFSIRIIEGPLYRAQKIRFSGNQAITQRELRKVISTSEAGWWIFSRWETGIVLPSQLAVDVEQIKQLYLERGFYDAQVRLLVIRDEDEQELEIAFQIEEGPQRLIQDVELVWVDILPEMVSGKLLATRPHLNKAEPFSRLRLRKEQHRLYSVLQSQGYPNASVELQGNALQGSVRYLIKPGNRVTVGEIDVSGLVLTQQHVIERELLFKPGDAWNVKVLTETQQSLARLGLFREVQLAPEDGVLDGPVEDVSVRVQERPTGSFEIGAAFTTEDGLHLFGDLSQRNFLGRSHKARLGVDGYLKPGESRVEAGSVRLGYTVPKVLSSRNDLLSEIFFQSNSQFIDEYSFDRYGAWVALHRQLLEKVRLIFGVSGYRDNLFDVSSDVVVGPRDTSETDFFLPGITVDIDLRDNALSPTSGYRSYLDLKVANENFLSDVSFAYGAWKQSLMFQLGKRVIWANRLQLEALEPYGDTEVIPLSQRLFLGGQNSLRGFSKNAVGPRSSSGVVVGGDRSISASTELRYSFSDTVTGLLFLDVGQAFLENKGSFDGAESDLDDLRYSPGFGFHYNTPIGPIRAELGFALDREFGERFGRINVSIGTSY